MKLLDIYLNRGDETAINALRAEIEKVDSFDLSIMILELLVHIEVRK